MAVHVIGNVRERGTVKQFGVGQTYRVAPFLVAVRVVFPVVAMRPVKVGITFGMIGAVAVGIRVVPDIRVAGAQGWVQVVLIGVLTIRDQHDDLEHFAVIVGQRAAGEFSHDHAFVDQVVDGFTDARVKHHRAPLHAHVDRGVPLGGHAVDIVVQFREVVVQRQDRGAGANRADRHRNRRFAIGERVEMRGAFKRVRGQQIRFLELFRDEVHAMGVVMLLRNIELV